MNTIDPLIYTKYVITGKLVRGGKFRKETPNLSYALGINLWNGRVWGIRKDNGKRQLLKRVTN